MDTKIENTTSQPFRKYGEKTKYKFISPKTSERHIKEFEFPSDAYYWGMTNLDLSLDWEAVPYYE